MISYICFLERQQISANTVGQIPASPVVQCWHNPFTSCSVHTCSPRWTKHPQNQVWTHRSLSLWHDALGWDFGEPDPDPVWTTARCPFSTTSGWQPAFPTQWWNVSPRETILQGADDQQWADCKQTREELRQEKPDSSFCLASPQHRLAC